jgi:hypothetical protein
MLSTISFWLFKMNYIYHFYNNGNIGLSYIKLGSNNPLPPPPPTRPGTSGITIIGSLEKIPIFEIDSQKSTTPLNWNDLNNNTDVQIQGDIDDSGRLSNIVLNRGEHQTAAKIIRTAMTTWRYNPVMKGKIKYWYNLPSTEEKLTIDITDLKKNTQNLSDTSTTPGIKNLFFILPYLKEREYRIIR